MGSVVISGATSGAITLSVPAEAGTRTLTLPATTGTILTNDISAAGDTAAGDNAAIGYTSAEGLILTGQGSTSDVTIKNDADGTVFYVPTGTSDAFFKGGVYLTPTNGSTSTCVIELGANRTGNGYCYIDLAGDTTYSDFGLRILRGNSGANTASLISHRGTGNLELLCVEAAPMTFGTSGAERMRILAGGGITFNGDTAAANALDDYEEGTWTPIVQGSTSGARTAGSVNKGYYVKIGNVITISGTIHCEGTATIAGNVIISGLPYQATSVTQGRSSGTTATSGIFTCATDYNIKLLVDPNATFIYVVQAKEQATIGYSHTPTVGTGVIYGFEVSYRTV
jgi:hypothetical protein